MLDFRSVGDDLCFPKPLRIVDVGSRFGIHPSFSSIKEISTFDLFEADKEECDRLYDKYSRTNYHLKIYNYAVGSTSVAEMLKIQLNQYSNPAVNSISARISDESPMYSSISTEHTPVGRIDATCCTLDDLVGDGLQFPDFIKIDVEGYEPEVIEGAKATLTNVIGVRLEVSFTKLQQQSPSAGTFTKIHEALTDYGMNLIGLDYDGRGDYWSPYCSGRYGMLRSTDATYLQDFKRLKLSKDLSLRAAIFCFLNSAADVGISLLTEAANQFGRYTSNSCPLEIWTKKTLAAHFHGLKWNPGQDRHAHQEAYESVFASEYPSMQKFNESIFFNPA